MGDGHGSEKGHGDSHGSKGETCRSDPWFGQVQGYITHSIQRFVAFLFILITIGAIIGYVAGTKNAEYLVLVPAISGLIAYYNRDFALAVLSLSVLIIIFL